MRVALVAMPFYSTEAPAVGISLLKAGLAAVRIPCDVLYLNIAYAEAIGRETHDQVCAHKNDGGETLLGEWVFAEECFPGLLPGATEYARHLGESCPEAAPYYATFLRLRDSVRQFIARCVESVRWDRYDVIGFTTVFDQTVASLLLARRLKERFPDKMIVFGGANCELPMGLELHRQFPFVDYVLAGEADCSFVELVRLVRDGRAVTDVPGLVLRRGGESTVTSPPEPVKDLDALPLPDFDDYFEQLGQAFPAAAPRALPMEASRGCWWGARSQCRFCGLNPQTIAFRAKSPARTLGELSVLRRRYDPPAITTTDNILDMAAFRDLLPRLRTLETPVHLFYEVKANLRTDQVNALARAGVLWVQPGIESLNSRSLRLMGKGVSALQNVLFLRNCVQFGVQPIWNLITGIPGETEEDYRRTVDLIRSIGHLPPPGGHSSFCLHRFSPYFREPQRYGLRRVRPKASYRFAFPLPDASLARLAYYFDFDYREDVAPPAASPIADAVCQWRSAAARGSTLRSTAVSPSRLVIDDGRDPGRRRHVLEYGQKEMYEHCAEVRRFDDIVHAVRSRHECRVDPEVVGEFLGAMVALRLMAREGDAYLSLAVPSGSWRTSDAPAVTRAPAWRPERKRANA